MKLYATVTSERASKGQGGNKYLEIELKVGDRVRPIGHIFLDLHDDAERYGDDLDEWVLSWKQIDQIDPDIIAQGHIKGTKSKGNKQKGERLVDLCSHGDPVATCQRPHN